MSDMPRFIMLVAPPGAGKTQYAKMLENSHTMRLSSDSIRLELWGSDSVQRDPTEVFSLMQKRALEGLKNGYDVVYDATNITRKNRATILNALPNYVMSEAHIVWAPIEELIARDASRERTVGKAVIDKMLKVFQSPYFDEGFKNIKIVHNSDFDQCEYARQCAKAMDIAHNNEHHTLSILEHCKAAAEYLYGADDDLFYAAQWHDIGKPYVKAFVDGRGNSSEQAHFYGHQNVGAWETYGLLRGNPKVAWLVSEHMGPFLNTKYWRNLPTFMKKEIDLLHEADLAAH